MVAIVIKEETKEEIIMDILCGVFKTVVSTIYFFICLSRINKIPIGKLVAWSVTNHRW